MTEEKMRIDVNGNIDFSCINHSGNTNVCIMCSTLEEVLVSACEQEHIDQESIFEGDGVMKMHIRGASYPLVMTFKAVHETFKKVADQNPWYLKIT